MLTVSSIFIKYQRQMHYINQIIYFIKLNHLLNDKKDQIVFGLCSINKMTYLCKYIEGES